MCRGMMCPWFWRMTKVKYLGTREAAIKAWFGEGLDKTTLFELTA